MITPIHTIVNEIANLLTGKVVISDPGTGEHVKAARLKVHEFFDEKPTSAYLQIDSSTYAARIDDLLSNPELLNQGSYGICGATAMLFAIIKYHPFSFVVYALQLYKEGKGVIGGLEVKPGSNFFTYNFVEIVNKLKAEGKVNNYATDLILIGAIEDFTNTIADFDADDPSDFFIGQYLLTTSKDFFNKTGLFGEALVERSSINVVSRLNQLSIDHFVVLAFKSGSDKFFEPAFPIFSGKMPAGHICVLRGTPIKLVDPSIRPEDQTDNTAIIVEVFTWGSYTKVITTKGDFYGAMSRFLAVKV